MHILISIFFALGLFVGCGGSSPPPPETPGDAEIDATEDTASEGGEVDATGEDDAAATEDAPESSDASGDAPAGDE